MFLTLLAVTLAISFVVSFLVALLFRNPIAQILAHIVAHESSEAWARFVIFTVFVAGASGGAEIYRLERYINPGSQRSEPIELNVDRWVFEAYQSMIGAVQSIVWILATFFIITLIAIVLVRIFESRRHVTTPSDK